MKTILAFILSLLCATSAFSGQQFDAATWRAVHTYDIAALLKLEASLVGRIVTVHFNYRSEKLRHTEPSWFEASLWQRNPQEKKGFSGLRVMVAKKDLPAFKTITSDFKSLAELTAYGRVEKIPDLNDTCVRLLGRKVVVDAAGNATVDW
ncbi:MAG: hypothetical protein DLM73_16770 [Chthoniobacterales bacterium]|nr:MAG: hypothetical protein DLM73_16770 [Chthoniobacterales bacterium]